MTALQTPSPDVLLRRPPPAAWLLAAALLICTACREPEQPLVLPDDAELRLVEDAGGRPVAVDALGLEPGLLGRLRRASWSDAQWSAVFAVTGAEGAPVPGDYRVTASAVRFIPAAPFARRTAYAVTWKDAEASRLTFEPARDGSASTTQVAAIYPSADLLPQNVARLHIQFTGPMTHGRAADHVVVVEEESGDPIDPFVHESPTEGAPDSAALAEEWSEDGRLLTLLFARDEEDHPLVQIASRYRLIVDRGWEDDKGIPLRDTFEKVFAVSKNDRQAPDPTAWKVTPPVSTAAPLVVDFPAPLDRAELDGALAVVSQDRTLSGSVRISNEERRWVFSPEKPWVNGRYVVRVVDRLEDPSGNVLGEGGAGTVIPFVVDIPEPPKRRRGRNTG